MNPSDQPPPWRPDEQLEGHLVVQEPAVAWRTFEDMARRLEAGGWWVGWQALRERLHTVLGVRPESYRGPDRAHVERWCGYPLPEARASELVFERLGPGPVVCGTTFFDEDVLPDLSLAGDVLRATAVPADWEIIRVSRAGREADGRLLGFDVGHWATGFSCMRDTCFTAQWHPCPEAEWRELREHTSGLNAAGLLRHAEEAHEFREWYIGQPWAETEGFPHEFQVMQVTVRAP